MSEPLWTPSRARVDNANLSRLMRFVQGSFDSMVDNYPALYDFSIRHSDKFWKALW